MHVALTSNEPFRVLGCSLGALAFSFSSLETVLRVAVLLASLIYAIMKIVKTAREWRDEE